MADQLNKSYALAIYDIAEENNKLDEYLKDIKDISNLISTNSDLHSFIENPKVNSKKKQEIFKKQLIDQVDKDLLSFLLILIEKDNLLSLSEILEEMKSIHLEKNNEVTAFVKTVTELTDEQKKKLIEKLEAKYNKKITLKTEIDKSILGGIFIKVKDDITDGTFRTKYEELRALMLNR